MSKIIKKSDLMEQALEIIEILEVLGSRLDEISKLLEKDLKRKKPGPKPKAKKSKGDK